VDWRIEGIDVAQGLRLCAGNQALYADLLDAFANSLAKFPEEFQQAIDGNCLTDAQRFTHTLKGVSANVGAGACSRLFENLDEALRDVLMNHTPVQSIAVAQAALLADLPPLQDQLRGFLARPHGTLPLAQPADAAPLHTLCRELADLLRANSPQAEHIVQTHGVVLRAGLGSAFALLQQQVQGFDFSEALVTLTDAAQAAKISMD
jgi:HPt (histidine-containing phosphotransfer) domain-containing protein